MTSVAGKYTLLQELKDREAPTYAARCEGPDGASELVAIERYATDTAAGPEDEASLEDAARGAQILTALYHPNLAQVREVVVSAGEVLAVGNFVDGDSYESLLPGGTKFAESPFALRLAIVADVVEGLAALHEFARAHDCTIVHGGVTPRNVIVCGDGRSRLVRVCNLFPEQVSPASPTLGYIAPELLDPSRRPDPSVDVFGAGVMLWEVLAGKRLAVQTNLPSLLLKEFEKGPPRGIPLEDLGWAKALIPIVERALAPADQRYEDAEQMARSLRAVFGAEGTPKEARAKVEQVAEFVEENAGDRIRQRRAELGFSAPLPITSSRATIAPIRSRPSMPEPEPLPLPPRVARIELPTMVDEEEFSSRSAVPVAPSLTSLTAEELRTEIDVRPPDPDEDEDSRISSFPSAPPFPKGARKAEVRQVRRARDPASSSQPLFDDRRERRPILWIAVGVAAAVALVMGYGLGRGQKTAAPVAAPKAEMLTHEAVKPELVTADPPAHDSNGDMAGVPGSNVGAAGVSVPRPSGSGEPYTTEIELVPEAKQASKTRRSRHAAARATEPAPAVASPTPQVQPPAEPEAPAPEGRQKFNPQGI